MDTADAVFSRRNLEEKKRILKDPHMGAFAVIAIIVILLFQFSAVYTILGSQKNVLAFIFIPVISRCTAGIAMLNLKPVFDTGYAVSFRRNSKPRHTVFICILAASCFLASWFVIGIAALALLAGALTGIIVTIYLYKQFQGISGDLSGSIITVSEFAALLCMALLLV